MQNITRFSIVFLIISSIAIPALADKAMPDVTMKGHASRVIALAYSPDGTRLASISDDGFLKLWDTATHKEVASLEGVGAQKNQIRFAPDGKTLVTLGFQNNVLVVDVGTGKMRKNIPISNLRGGPAAFDLSPDGNMIAVVGRSTLRLIDAASGETKSEYEIHKLYAITSVAFSPDGSRVVTASTDNTGLVIDLAAGKAVQTLNLKLKGEAVIFTRDGKTVLGYSTDHMLRSFNVESGESTKVLNDPVPFSTMQLTGDGKTLVLGGAGRAPSLLSLPDGKLNNTLYDSEDLVTSAAMSPDGKWIAGGANQGPIYLWKVK